MDETRLAVAKADNAPKLTDAQQRQVCQWFAEFRPLMEVVGLVKSEFGIELPRNNVWRYSTAAKWRPLVERLRQQWALGVMELPLAHKRGRLEKLVTLLERAEKNRKISEFARINQCAHLLSEIRLEMEDKKAQFTNVYLTTIHQYSDEELLQRRDEVLSKLQQLGGFHGLRRFGKKAADGGAAIAEGSILDADDGGGGLHQRLDGPGDATGAEDVAADAQDADARQSDDEEARALTDAGQERPATAVHGGGAGPEAGGQEDAHGNVGGATAPLRQAGEPEHGAL